MLYNGYDTSSSSWRRVFNSLAWMKYWVPFASKIHLLRCLVTSINFKKTKQILSKLKVNDVRNRSLLNRLPLRILKKTRRRDYLNYVSKYNVVKGGCVFFSTKVNLTILSEARAVHHDEHLIYVFYYFYKY